MSTRVTNDDIRCLYNLLQRTVQEAEYSFSGALASFAFVGDDRDMQEIIQRQTSSLLDLDILKSQEKVNLMNPIDSTPRDLMLFHNLSNSLSASQHLSSSQNTYSFSKCLELADDLSLASAQVAKVTSMSMQQQQPQQQPQYQQQLPPRPPAIGGNDTLQPNEGKYHIMEDIRSDRGKRNIVEVDGESGPNVAKKNSFSSAKDRFQQEGGKLERNQKKPENKPSNSSSKPGGSDGGNDEPLPPELAHCDKALVEKIEADIIHHGQTITFDDISGLEFAKECVVELICWPMKQPQLFQGLRSLPRGVLLFGPPGTGKTLIGKAIAHQSGATFFSISASSLMSKWIGEGEKTVRTLFAVAAYRQPSVVFIDEVDSLLCQRSSDENEATRRIKTEFMVQLDGASTNLDARVVIIGATNRPEELDEAVRRRFVKRLYIPLPDEASRRSLLKTLLKDVFHKIDPNHLEQLTERTEGYSGADIRSLCTEAAMGPIRELAQLRRGDLKNINSADVPPITVNHFDSALETVTPSVSQNDLQRYIDWNSSYGSYRRMF